MQEHEPCEQHRERADATLPLVVIRPPRPLLVRRRVVKRVAAAREPSNEKEHRKHDAGQGQEALPRRWESVRRLHHRARLGEGLESPS
jgi:hypothetical protein